MKNLRKISKSELLELWSEERENFIGIASDQADDMEIVVGHLEKSKRGLNRSILLHANAAISVECHKEETPEEIDDDVVFIFTLLADVFYQGWDTETYEMEEEIDEAFAKLLS